jgi:Ca2+-binding RTX toxin-like protein
MIGSDLQSAMRSRRRVALATTVSACCAAVGLTLATGGAESSAARAPTAGLVSPQEAEELRRDDRGLYVAFCPAGEEAASTATDASTDRSETGPRARAQVKASAAEASHAGWPENECLKMDKGPPGLSHTLVGLKHVHNWLLGGYGNDTIYAGDEGDVIWGDYHPERQPESQRDYLHGGPGSDWIYSSHGYNEIWTGGGNDHLALVYGHGVVYCNGSGLKTFVMRYLPQNRPWKLVGCSHKVLDRYRA